MAVREKTDGNIKRSYESQNVFANINLNLTKTNFCLSWLTFVILHVLIDY